MAARCMMQSQPSRSAASTLRTSLGRFPVGLDQRFPGTPLEEVEVAADDEMAFLLEQVDQLRSDVPLMTCDKYLHVF